MPSKHVVRNFHSDGIYHIYNRGVEKRQIFMADSDYKIFMYYLLVYSSPLNKILLSYPELPFRLQAKNLSNRVKIISYCLMPNHFHILIQQTTKNGISKLMQQLTNGYTEYFNKKYKRQGALMQGTYKAVEATKDELLMHITRYIHLNPVVSNICNSAELYKWSSANEYSKNLDGLCSKDLVFSLFSTKKQYENFIQDHLDYARKLETIKHLIIESDGE